MSSLARVKSLIIFQHNDLVRAPLRLNNAEARLFAFALSCLHQQEDNLEIELSIAEVASAHGGTAYDLVRRAVESIMQKTVKTENTDPKSPRFFEAKAIFVNLRVDEATGKITGRFNEVLKPLLLQLNGHFTKVELVSILTLKSGHAHKLYWLLKSFRSLAEENDDKYTYKYQQLRDDMLGVDSEAYPLWAEFNRNILKPAIKEICGTGWLVKAEAEKAGKKVDEILFTLPIVPGEEKKPKKLKGQKETPALVASSDLGAKVIARLKKLRLTESQISQVLDVLENDEAQLAKLIKVTYPLHRDLEAGNKLPDNLGSATLALLKTEFPALYKKIS